MDLTRLAVDAGQFINRAVQYTGETLGQAERTELDSSLEGLLALADSTKTWTDLILTQTEVLLQPNPADRLEDRLYERLDWTAPPRPRAQELLGETLLQAGSEVGPSTPYGTCLMRCGEAQKQMGEAERKFVQSCHIHFLSPLRSFSEGEFRTLQYERRMLVNKRLDLDIAKTRLRKAREAEAEARNLNSSPQGDDYVAHVSFMFSFLRVKWLKMWAQEISQAETELSICQSLFDRQALMARELLEGIHTTHVDHMRCLTDLVEAQTVYYAQCNQHSQDMQRDLASIPAVLCSNNWQAASASPTRLPPASDDLTSPPPGLGQAHPFAMVIHGLPPSLPDLDQVDKPLPGGADQAPFRSSVTKTHAQQQNNNNNNISLLTLLPSAVGASSSSSYPKHSSTEAVQPVPNSTATTPTSHSLSDNSSTPAQKPNLCTETETGGDPEPRQTSLPPPAGGVLLSATYHETVPVFAANEIPSDSDVTTADSCLPPRDAVAPPFLLMCDDTVAMLTPPGERTSQAPAPCGGAGEKQSSSRRISTVTVTTTGGARSRDSRDI